jgi:hypothetical protein
MAYETLLWTEKLTNRVQYFNIFTSLFCTKNITGATGNKTIFVAWDLDQDPTTGDRWDERIDQR